MRMKMDRACDSDAWLRLGVRGEGDDAGGWAESGLEGLQVAVVAAGCGKVLWKEKTVRALRAGTGRKAAHLGGGDRLGELEGGKWNRCGGVNLRTWGIVIRGQASEGEGKGPGWGRSGGYRGLCEWGRLAGNE